MENRLRCAVIGTGNMGKNHLRVYSELEGMELAAFCDSDADIRKAYSEKYGIPAYDDYAEMLKKEDIDIVSICVPTSMHYEIGKACLSEGLHVLLEKPIADTVRHAEELIGIAKTQGSSLLVGHIERFNPAIAKAKEIVESGALGRVVALSTRRVGGFPAQIRDADVAVDLAIHDIDIANYLLGEIPKSIDVHKEKNHTENRADSVEFFLKYSSASAYIQANWITPVKVRKLSITGTEGYLEADCINQTIDFYKSNYEKMRMSYESYSDFVLKYGDPERIDVPVGKREPLVAEIMYFLSCIRNKKAVDSQFALDALKIAVS